MMIHTHSHFTLEDAVQAYSDGTRAADKYSLPDGDHTMTHTPGQWEVACDEPNTKSLVRMALVNTRNGKQLIDCTGSGRNFKEDCANAALIAAAPELLDALKGMLEWARRVKEKNPGPEVINALNAIARADGRTVTA